MGEVAGHAPVSAQTARFEQQVRERFMNQTAAPEQKERAEEIVHRTFEATTTTNRAADSDAIQKMREQLASEGSKRDQQIEQEAKTQGVLGKIKPLLGPSGGPAAPAA